MLWFRAIILSIRYPFFWAFSTKIFQIWNEPNWIRGDFASDPSASADVVKCSRQFFGAVSPQLGPVIWILANPSGQSDNDNGKPRKCRNFSRWRPILLFEDIITDPTGWKCLIKSCLNKKQKAASKFLDPKFAKIYLRKINLLMQNFENCSKNSWFIKNSLIYFLIFPE